MNRAPEFAQLLRIHEQTLANTLSRLRALKSSWSEPTPRQEVQEAFLFSLERAAWAAIELANAWVFEMRLGIPRKENESFDILSRAGWISLETGRKLRQLSEYRSLSRRESARIDWRYLQGDLSQDLELFESWRKQALSLEPPAAAGSETDSGRLP